MALIVKTFSKICIIIIASINITTIFYAAADSSFWPLTREKIKLIKESSPHSKERKFLINKLREVALKKGSTILLNFICNVGTQNPNELPLLGLVRELLEDTAIGTTVASLPAHDPHPLFEFIFYHRSCLESPDYNAVAHLLIKHSSQDALDRALERALLSINASPYLLVPLIKQLIDKGAHIQQPLNQQIKLLPNIGFADYYQRIQEQYQKEIDLLSQLREHMHNGLDVNNGIPVRDVREIIAAFMGREDTPMSFTCYVESFMGRKLHKNEYIDEDALLVVRQEPQKSSPCCVIS